MAAGDVLDLSNTTLVETIDQGETYLCGLFSAEVPFTSAGFDVELIPCYEKVRGISYKIPGEPCGFDDVKNYVNEFANQADVFLQWFNGSGDADDLPTVDQLVRDHWFVIVGVAEWDIKAGQKYYHFFNITGFDGTNFTIDDTFKNEDGVSVKVPITELHQAMVDNFDVLRDAVSFKIVLKK